MANGKVYNIPEINYDWFKNKMEKLSKRCIKLNIEPIKMMTVGYHRCEDKSSRHYRTKMYEIFVAITPPIINGYTFAGRICHMSSGNFISGPETDLIPSHFWNAESECEHCHQKRERNDTFIVHNIESDTFMQVGSSCLKDFIGHGDVKIWVDLANIYSSIDSWARQNHEYSNISDYLIFPVEEMALMTSRIILNHGYVTKSTEIASLNGNANKFIYSTNTRLNMEINDPFYDFDVGSFSEKEKELAKDAIQWIKDTTQDTPYIRNCKTLVNSEFIGFKQLGTFVSIFGSYHISKFFQEQNDFSKSDFVGAIGQRVNLEVKVISMKQLEFSYLVNMIDKEGNKITWFASNNSLKKYIDKTVEIKATIKKHDVFETVKMVKIKSTIVNRVKVERVIE